MRRTSHGQARRGRNLLGWTFPGANPRWACRNWLRWPGSRRHRRKALLRTALAAVGRGWPVLPGARAVTGLLGPCSCDDPCCPAPGAHPHDPPLLAASTDARMVSWWWSERSPGSPVLLATGRSVCAVSLPTEAGQRALEYFDLLRLPLGPVLASRRRYVLLVAPYTLEGLGGVLADLPWVPGSLRFHGPDGYLLLPPAQAAAGPVRWIRPPAEGAPLLPQVDLLLGGLIAASRVAPDGSRLAF
ncbi:MULTISPECIES: bifunctional DNA primase/polymerase [Kitasatospora]|uniref:DNA primase/polymerase bifunctional N-terminal domain-containing protein n=1 Tax=Kitasatospora cystarginea TaxID=58350 RepID=A0ABN3E091_9ACTN